MAQPELNLLRCAGCGAMWLSPVGRLLVEEEECCLRCDGPLVFDEQEDENVSTVRRAWARWLAGDVEGLLDQHDPEVEMRPVRADEMDNVQPVYRGHEGIRRFVEDWSPDWEILPNELQAFGGDRVLTLGRLLQKGAKRETYAVAWVFQVKERKIVSTHGYMNPADALRALAVGGND